MQLALQLEGDCVGEMLGEFDGGDGSDGEEVERVGGVGRQLEDQPIVLMGVEVVGTGREADVWMDEGGRVIRKHKVRSAL